MQSPFNYLQFATGERFYDREAIRRDLWLRFLSGPTTAVLYGPRRCGKSSLDAELVMDLERAGMPCVTLDVAKVPTTDLFVSAYAQKKLLIALAFEPARGFDEAYRRRHLPGSSSTVNFAKRKLVEGGHLEQSGDECLVADPFFVEFLRTV